MYFNQQTLAGAWVCMVKNNEKHWKMMKKYLFQLLCIWTSEHMAENDKKHSKMMKKVNFTRGTWEAYKEKRKKTNKLFFSFFFMSLSWASRTHDEKGTFFMIFKRFPSFSTMRTHAQACVCWWKYTTFNGFRTIFRINFRWTLSTL